MDVKNIIINTKKDHYSLSKPGGNAWKGVSNKAGDRRD
jgi:hypothetical protein